MLRSYQLKYLLFIVGCLGAAFPLTAAAEEAPTANERLLVFDFKATDEGDALLAQSAQRFLVSELSEMGGYDIIQKTDMVRLLKLTEQRQQLGCTDESCAAEYGELLNAGLYVRGDLARLGGKAVLTLQLFSIKAGKIDAQRTVTLGTIDELAGQMKDETYALMGREVIGPQTAWYANPWTWVLVGAGVGAISAGFYALNHEPDPVTLDPEIINPPSGPLGTISFGLQAAPGGLVWRW